MNIAQRALAVFLMQSVSVFAEGSEAGRYLEYPLTNPGKVFKAEKVVNPETGEIDVKLSQNGQPTWTSLEILEVREASIRKAMLGTLSARVFSRMTRMGVRDVMRVAIYLRHPPVVYPDKTRHGKETLLAASLAATSLQPIASGLELEKRFGLSSMEARGIGILVGKVTRTQLEALRSDSDVAAVEEENEEKRLAPELSVLAASAYNPGPVSASSGYGVRAATFETGITGSFLNCIGIAPVSWDANISNVGWDIRHSNAVFRAMVAAAPAASFYHRRSDYFSGSSEQNYIINNGLQTLSMSVERGATTPYRSTYSEFLVMDDFAYRYPYPVFVNPAGNAGYAYEVNWQCYNAISVGNVRHTNGSTYDMAECTQTKNPPPVYGGCISGSGESCSGDREMPYLVVPGIPPSGTEFATTCVEGGNGSLSCGTSWSAAVGNGTAAAVISADARMVSWPEKVRAALIVTAQNEDGGDWLWTTDGRDGAGVASGSAAAAFAKNHTSVSPGNSAVQQGMSAGSMYASDFGTGNKRFYYLVPNPKPQNSHLRVVITWDSNPIVGGTTNALSDLDLVVQKNGGTQSSLSWDGNVEVVDVPQSDLTAGGAYYIDVAPVTNRIPTSGARASYFYYAVAWAWVKDHAD